MDIEEVAEKTPEKIVRVYIDPGLTGVIAGLRAQSGDSDAGHSDPPTRAVRAAVIAAS